MGAWLIFLFLLPLFFVISFFIVRILIMLMQRHLLLLLKLFLLYPFLAFKLILQLLLLLHLADQKLIPPLFFIINPLRRFLLLKFPLMLNQFLLEFFEELIVVRLFLDILEGHSILGREEFQSVVLVTAVNCFVLLFPF